MIHIVRAPAYLSVQDLGRPYTLTAGVPRGGAMDRFAIVAANLIAGNPANAAGLEWALSAGSIRFDVACSFAACGAQCSLTLNGKQVPPLARVDANRGDELEVDAPTRGRFLYLGLSGGIDVPQVLRSRSTYLPAHFGGLSGRLLKSGDDITLGPTTTNASQTCACPPELLPNYQHASLRITRTTDSDMFDESAWSSLLGTSFRLSHASDRTGYRLEGSAIPHRLGSLPSDAGCPGTIQVPTQGKPIILMADAPTVGGYPKIAVVCEADLPILAQRAPGEAVRFELITIERSQQALRDQESDLQRLQKLCGAPSA